MLAGKEEAPVVVSLCTLRAWALRMLRGWMLLEHLYVRPLSLQLHEQRDHAPYFVFLTFQSLLATLQTLGETILSYSQLDNTKLSQVIQREIVTRADSFGRWQAGLPDSRRLLETVLVTSASGQAWSKAYGTMTGCSPDLLLCLKFPCQELRKLCLLADNVLVPEGVRQLLTSLGREAERAALDETYRRLAMSLRLPVDNHVHHPSAFGQVLFRWSPQGWRGRSPFAALAFVYARCLALASVQDTAQLLSSIPPLSPLHPVTSTQQRCSARGRVLPDGFRLMLLQHSLFFKQPPELQLGGGAGNLGEQEVTFKLVYALSGKTARDLEIIIPSSIATTWAAILRASGIQDRHAIYSTPLPLQTNLAEPAATAPPPPAVAAIANTQAREAGQPPAQPPLRTCIPPPPPPPLPSSTPPNGVQFHTPPRAPTYSALRGRAPPPRRAPPPARKSCPAIPQTSASKPVPSPEQALAIVEETDDALPVQQAKPADTQQRNQPQAASVSGTLSNNKPWATYRPPRSLSEPVTPRIGGSSLSPTQPTALLFSDRDLQDQLNRMLRQERTRAPAHRKASSDNLLERIRSRRSVIVAPVQSGKSSGSDTENELDQDQDREP